MTNYTCTNGHLVQVSVPAVGGSDLVSGRGERSQGKTVDRRPSDCYRSECEPHGNATSVGGPNPAIAGGNPFRYAVAITTPPLGCTTSGSATTTPPADAGPNKTASTPPSTPPTATATPTPATTPPTALTQPGSFAYSEMSTGAARHAVAPQSSTRPETPLAPLIDTSWPTVDSVWGVSPQRMLAELHRQLGS
jgi:hypothetical protein